MLPSEHEFVKNTAVRECVRLNKTADLSETEVIEIRWSGLEAYVLTLAYLLGSVISKITAKSQGDLG